MRDQYGRITPDFKAWEKLGYYVEDIHENTYILTNSIVTAPPKGK